MLISRKKYQSKSIKQVHRFLSLEMSWKTCFQNEVFRSPQCLWRFTQGRHLFLDIVEKEEKKKNQLLKLSPLRWAWTTNTDSDVKKNNKQVTTIFATKQAKNKKTNKQIYSTHPSRLIRINACYNCPRKSHCTLTIII